MNGKLKKNIEDARKVLEESYGDYHDKLERLTKVSANVLNLERLLTEKENYRIEAAWTKCKICNGIGHSEDYEDISFCDACTGNGGFWD